MIRISLDICKAFHKIKHLDDHTVYSMIESSCFSMVSSCPSCHAPSAHCSHNGSYQRHLVCYSNGCVCDRLISVHSLLCPSCGHSHALLPSLIIPWSSYSLGFTISLLYSRITRKFPTVHSLCEHFDISERTYYRMKVRFSLDSKALLEAIHTFMQAVDLWDALTLEDPLSIHRALSLFFRSTGHSFMQPCVRMRPKIDIRGLPPGYHQIS